ncbi:sulfatase family protein [Aquimarina spongiae]|uniref:Arylsulfatase A n=1 Tax=Aquimarina spongiae TaxID=570521 RepID=A0A1M6A1S5_9FLAO|nr:sulfatase-like hydrolase/transferase [Aquimarina spongiae]SHI30153.1 Arylsulfatase A [Aquimarina spongiae]
MSKNKTITYKLINKVLLHMLAFVVTIFFTVSCKETSKAEKQSQESNLTKKDERPNIVLILCDDLGYADVGFNGAKDILTPAIDTLANNGAIFTSAYVAHPFCGPSRAALMTGRYPHNIGSQYNLPRAHNNDQKGISIKEPFISKVLNKAGYYTGAIGKWHLGTVSKYHPNNRGFDHFFGFLGGGHNYFPEQFKVAYQKEKEKGNDKIWEYITPLEENGADVDETEYITDALSREAQNFINQASKKESPFFLYLSYNAPHTPLEAKDEDLEVYAHIEDRNRRIYAAMVHAIDRGVGKLVSSLQKTGELENTLIVFLSDNGGRTDKGGVNTPLRGRKGNTLEGGIRVPMFFHWPKNVPKGKTYEHPVSALDFYPTLVKLAKAKMPKNKIIDGKDIWYDFIQGKKTRPEEPIFTLRHRTGSNEVGIRLNNWKAYKGERTPWKLYNIVNDIEEKNDLSEQHPEVLEQLVAKSNQWAKTHIEPKWFHDKKTEENWSTLNMPNFEETFTVE